MFEDAEKAGIGGREEVFVFSGEADLWLAVERGVLLGVLGRELGAVVGREG